MCEFYNHHCVAIAFAYAEKAKKSNSFSFDSKICSNHFRFQRCDVATICHVRNGIEAKRTKQEKEAETKYVEGNKYIQLANEE